MTQANFESLFLKWNNALQTGSAKDITQLYEKDAILLPTVSNNPCHNHQEIEQYFIQFQKRKPNGVINESNTRSLGSIAINSGIYSFTFSDNSQFQARYTFVYHWNGDDWKIIEHHSSLFPH